MSQEKRNSKSVSSSQVPSPGASNEKLSIFDSPISHQHPKKPVPNALCSKRCKCVNCKCNVVIEAHLRTSTKTELPWSQKFRLKVPLPLSTGCDCVLNATAPVKENAKKGKSDTGSLFTPAVILVAAQNVVKTLNNRGFMKEVRGYFIIGSSEKYFPYEYLVMDIYFVGDSMLPLRMLQTLKSSGIPNAVIIDAVDRKGKGKEVPKKSLKRTDCTRTILYLSGLWCEKCVTGLDALIKETTGVFEDSVNVTLNKAVVEHDLSLLSREQLKSRIEDVGYKVTNMEVCIKHAYSFKILFRKEIIV